MKHYLKFYTLLLLIFSSCHSGESVCPPDKEFYDEVPSHYRTPLQSYHENDTLKFKSQSGDIYSFVGGVMDSGYNTAFLYRDECSGKDIHHQKYYGYNFYSKDYKTDLHYFIDAEARYNSLSFHIIINNVDFNVPPLLPPLNSPNYINNLLLDTIIYNNVLTISEISSEKDKAYLYYSLEEGIIKIFFKDKTTLTKMK